MISFFERYVMQTQSDPLSTSCVPLSESQRTA